MTNIDLILVAVGTAMVFLSIGIYTSEGTLTPNMKNKRYVVAKASGILGIVLLVLAGASALSGAMQFDPTR